MNTDRVNRIISDALKRHKANERQVRGVTRRHPADVTADRLGEATQKWTFTGAELDAIAVVIDALRAIAINDGGAR